MRRTLHLRTAPRPVHPPYGLFLDPHRASHTWWAVDSRTLLGLITVLGALTAALTVVAR